jgi:hypothetical protein
MLKNKKENDSEKPNGYVFDSITGRGHVKTAEERRLDEVREKRFEMRTRRSTFHKRLRLEKRKAELAARK